VTDHEHDEDEMPDDGMCYMMHCPNYRVDHPLGPSCPNHWQDNEAMDAYDRSMG
jgi:hypothetical protein